MNINYVFAGLVVSNRDQAVDWYQRLLGRAPTFLPNDAEAVWQLTSSSSVYLLADAQHAGQGVLTVLVEHLETTLEQIGARGITAGPIETIPDAGRKSVVTDPDGNAIAIIEIADSRVTEDSEE
ncbi:MAG: VOC family protein [Chloroflexota bacterium]